MKKYKTIIADPPWKYKGRGPASSKEHRPNSYGAAPSSEEKYGSLTMVELSTMPINEISEEKAHLYLWVTNAFVERGWKLCKDWGFEPKTIITWGKLKPDGTPSMKTGYYFRGATEHFIFATKGNLRLKNRTVEPTLFLSKRLPHSVKPDWFYDLVGRCSFDNKLELFARKKRIGFDVWGNQVECDLVL